MWVFLGRHYSAYHVKVQKGETRKKTNESSNSERNKWLHYGVRRDDPKIPCPRENA